MADTKTNGYNILRKLGVLASLAACFLFICSPVFAADYYVKTDGSDVANGLSWATAFETIQHAIDTAGTGNIVDVNVGTYDESIDFKGKSITIRSIDPNNWAFVESTVIDANDGDYVVIFNGSDANTVLTGFTIQNGYYGIYCDSNSTPIISKCVIEGTAKAAYLAGSVILTNNKIRNNLEGVVCLDIGESELKNNFIQDSYYGVMCWQNDNTPELVNNTIVNNSAYGVVVWPVADSNDPTIKNCILWDNYDDLEECEATYSCIEDANDANGVGNITSNPSFVSSTDYHLNAGSSCIDAGEPNSGDPNDTDIDGEQRIRSSVIDIGADEFWLARFHLKDDTGQSVAWFDNLGNLFLKGTLEETSSQSATVNKEFRYQNASDEDVVIIDTTNGNVYIDGNLYEGQTSLAPTGTDGEFIVRNQQNEIVAYFDVSGDLYLRGKVISLD